MPRMQPIYLDHNATTPLSPDVAVAMSETAQRFLANPASQHRLGRETRRVVEDMRERIGELLGAGPKDRVIFTSGGTESNNLALTGLGHRTPPQPPASPGGSPSRGPEIQTTRRAKNPRPEIGAAQSPHLVISPLEHPSIARTADHLGAFGWQIDRLPATRDGEVQVAALAGLLSPSTRLVSVMLASNETGVLQPVAELAAVCRAHRILIHTDATQVVGKLPVNFTELGVDALTCTAHKFHGPLGVGALIVREGVELAPLLYGGFQQGALRPGTESAPLAVGIRVALDGPHPVADQRRERMTTLRDSFERQIRAGDLRAMVIGAAAPRLPNTSNIAFVGLDRQALMMALDLASVACSTGSACASGSSEPSPALVAMGLPDEQISSSIRFSLGATTTEAEIDEAARRILNVVNRLRHA
jgi:cysteine desulfurase